MKRNINDISISDEKKPFEILKIRKVYVSEFCRNNLDYISTLRKNVFTDFVDDSQIISRVTSTYLNEENKYFTLLNQDNLNKLTLYQKTGNIICNKNRYSTSYQKKKIKLIRMKGKNDLYGSYRKTKRDLKFYEDEEIKVNNNFTIANSSIINSKKNLYNLKKQYDLIHSNNLYMKLMVCKLIGNKK